MKYILIAVALIGIGIIASRTLTPQTADAPHETQEVAATETETSTNHDEHGMTEEEERAATGESPVGTDIGMEMPETDMTGIAVDPNAKVFEVTGDNFSFNLKEIRVNEGDTVVINFKSIDGFHDWVVDEFDAATAKIRTGGSSSVTFVADKKGTFEYYCSIGSHRANGMVGNLIVE